MADNVETSRPVPQYAPMSVTAPVTEPAHRDRLLQKLQLNRDTPDPAFDALTRLAAASLAAPIVLLALGDGERPWIASHVGWDGSALPLPHLWPATTGAFTFHGDGLAFGAGQPVTFGGATVGMLWVMDRVARPLGPAERALLGDLSAMATGVLEQHHDRLVRQEQADHNARLAQALQHSETALADVHRHDSTETRTAQRRLKAVENRFRLLWQTTLDVVIMLDERSRIQFVNPAVEQVFGHTPESLLGEHLAVIQPEYLREPHRRGFQRYLDTGERRIDWRATETVGLHADGSEFPIEVSFSDMDVDGQRVFAACIRDISVRKAGEAAQRAMAEQLRQAQKMESLGVLAGGIAHDFNNVLAGILGNATLALEASTASATAAHLLQIQVGGRRGRELVQQILSFARRQPAVLAVTGLNDLVMESLELLRATLPHGVRLASDLSPTPCHVHADAAQIGQVVLNLCTNALHALHGAPGTITVGTAPVVLAGAAAEHRRVVPGRYARLWVHDDGHGMDDATVARIFEPFFTTKPAGQGTGLGLAVVHGIVGAHGGNIEVTSVEGLGTCFEIHLPLCESGPAASAVAPQPQVPQGAGQHVLYVDDDDVMRVMIQRLLGRLGYRATVCDGADAALALVRGDPSAFDMVVTDFDMPGQSGLQLAGHLLAIRPGLPIVISSGNVTEQMTRDALQAGVRALMHKQHTVEELGQVLARMRA